MVRHDDNHGCVTWSYHEAACLDGCSWYGSHVNITFQNTTTLGDEIWIWKSGEDSDFSIHDTCYPITITKRTKPDRVLRFGFQKLPTTNPIFECKLDNALMPKMVSSSDCSCLYWTNPATSSLLYPAIQVPSHHPTLTCDEMEFHYCCSMSSDSSQHTVANDCSLICNGQLTLKHVERVRQGKGYDDKLASYSLLVRSPFVSCTLLPNVQSIIEGRSLLDESSLFQTTSRPRQNPVLWFVIILLGMAVVFVIVIVVLAWWRRFQRRRFYQEQFNPDNHDLMLIVEDATYYQSNTGPHSTIPNVVNETG